MPSLVDRSNKPDNKKSSTMGEVDKAADEAKNFIQRLLGDVSKSSATKQIVLGASSGWATGFIAMKVGKSAALALGGGIILLQIANEKGYIKVNWDKVNQNIDRVADRVEEQVSGQGPSWMDKAERFVDRKVNQAERKIKKHQKKWYSFITGEDASAREMQMFMISFVAGVAIGLGTGNI